MKGTGGSRFRLMEGNPARVTFVAVFLLLTFRVFQFFPGMKEPHEVWIGVIAAMFLLVYVPWRAVNKYTIEPFEIYLLGLVLVLPIWSALSAGFVFGQPLFYGLLTGRSMFLAVGAPCCLVFAIRRGLLTTKDVESGLLVAAWFTLLVYLAISAVLNPSDYYKPYSKVFSDGRSFAFVGLDSYGVPRFKFNSIFLLYALFYYATAAIRRGLKRHALLAIVFAMATLYLSRGRSTILSMTAVILLLVVLYSPNRRAGMARMLGMLGAANILLVVVLVLSPDFARQLFGDFQDAFNVVINFQPGNDPSANARIGETLAAWPYIEKYWLFGVGVVSAQWQGGLESLMGEYFHASDIGLVGVVFQYGLLGLAYFYAQFAFAFKNARALRVEASSMAMLDACVAMMLYFFSSSFTASYFVFYPELTIFFLCIIYLGRRHPSCFSLESSVRLEMNRVSSPS